MEKKQLKLCPLGMAVFSEIIEGNYLYVDKTRQVYNMTHNQGKYVFLSRPRRFGKTLLTSTLHSYFDGRRDLFKGLAIEQLEKDWVKHPVLHFDMSLGKHMDKDQLGRFLGKRLEEHEKIYGITNPAVDNNDRLTQLIITAYEQTGKQVVVLIDEYDAPLLDIVHEEENLPVLRNVMRNFYSPLKGCDKYLRFVFLTGITKFSQLSIFSELNNIKNVSMEPAFADICGISKEELTGQLGGYIDAMAEANGCTHEKMLEELAYRYDGYHFTWPSPDIFNPFSIINAFSDKRLGNYWFGSGTPTFLIEMMRKFGVAPSQIGGKRLGVNGFDAPAEKLTSIVPLLYQSGYLTIKDYNPLTESYTLDIPNEEIRIGLMESLLPNYVYDRAGEWKPILGDMSLLIREDKIDDALKILQDFLASIPQCNNTNYEGHYQQMLYVIFTLLGYYVDVEVHTADGRIDVVMRTSNTLYLMELKINQSVETAQKQIDDKEYIKRFVHYKLPIVTVAINFSTEKHTITGWIIDDPRKA
ncbi:MAG: AAA family ATPase [Bacteroidales bacterium]|nr:AAA family ATPase [Bacteroidales bacterium]